MAFPGSGITVDEDVLGVIDEVEARQLEHRRPVERGLKVPVEGFEQFALLEAAVHDAPLDACLPLGTDFFPEYVLEQRQWTRSLSTSPREELLQRLLRVGELQKRQMVLQSRHQVVV